MNLNNIKAAFFDIDGTLYDLKNKEIHSSTIKSIQALQHHGFKVAIASSRPFETMTVPHLWDIKWDGIIASNGQCIYGRNKEVIQKITLSTNQLFQIFSIANKHRIPIYAVGEYEFFTQHHPLVSRFKEYFHIDTNRIEAYKGQEIYLLTLISSNDICNLFSEIKGIETHRNGTLNTDIFLKEYTKAFGVHLLMEHWNFPVNEYICFGDSPSDRSMIQQAHLGVAMGNADENTKKVADYICPPCDKNGISITLEKLLNLNLHGLLRR